MVAKWGVGMREIRFVYTMIILWKRSELWGFCDLYMKVTLTDTWGEGYKDQQSENNCSTVGLHIDHRSRHGQTTDPVQLKLCLSHKRRLASNVDVGFYCVNIMTTSFSSPERIVRTIMSGIITVTRLMSSLGIKDHWVKWIYLWFIHTLYAKRTRWNYMYIYFITKKCKFLKVDRGIYLKSCV